MFQTTIWTTIRQAGAQDHNALDRFADQYRLPVLRFIRYRGFNETDAEDICQDVFVRILAGDVLAKADKARGRFRSLILSVANHTILDRRRKKKDKPVEKIEIADREPDFDREWVLHMAERGLQKLRDEGSVYYDVFEADTRRTSSMRRSPLGFASTSSSELDLIPSPCAVTTSSVLRLRR